MSEASSGSRSGETGIATSTLPSPSAAAAQGYTWQHFVVRYKTAVSASIASLASTTVG
jgi:hypothetical protein